MSDNTADDGDDRGVVSRRGLVIGAVATVIVSALGVFAFSTFLDYRAYLASTVDRTGSFAESVAVHADETIRSVQLPLSAIFRARRQMATPASAPLTDENLDDLHDVLSTLGKILPQVREIALLDREGIVRVSSVSRDPEPLDMAEAPLFLERIDDHTGMTVIGVPTHFAGDERWSIPVGRRLVDADNAFAGVVVAMLRPDYLYNFYRALAIGRSGVVALHSEDGTLLARRPMNKEMIGLSVGGSSMFSQILAGLPGGVIDDLLMVDGVRRVAAYRAVPGRPLIVIVAMTRQEIVVTWWQRTRWKVLALFAALVALAVCAAMLLRQFERLETALRSLAQSRRQAERGRAELGELYQTAPVGLAFLDTDLRFLRVNQRMAAMIGLPVDQHVGKRVRDVIPGSAMELEPHLRRVIDHGDAILDREISGTTAARPGVERVWLENMRPVRDASGAVIGVSVVVQEFTDRKRQERRIEHLATHDSLTGLPNRALFHDRLLQALAQARRDGGRLAVMILDLDQFKEVNDRYGHPLGDRLLKITGERLQALVRSSDTLARLGGDEFALVQTGLNVPSGAGALAAKLIEALSVPVVLDGNQIHPGSSIGISLFPDDAIDADQLISNADMALYRAKANGRGMCEFYVPKMNSDMLARRDLESDLRRALNQDELVLHYQPRIDLVSGRIVGLEALLRWPRSDQRLRDPGSFIPTAEESGLIGPLGDWVIRTACQQAREWARAGLRLPVSINVSAAQLRHHDLWQVVHGLFEDYDVGSNQIEFEVVESLLLDPSIGYVQGFLQGLAEHNIGLIIDNFGAGQASLAALRQLPVSKIKVDRSLVQDIGLDLESEAMLRSIIALGRSLGHQVIAEGVETSRQLDFLRSIRCDQAQGFLLGRPASAEAVTPLLAA